jgi:hypothetical protein
MRRRSGRDDGGGAEEALVRIVGVDDAERRDFDAARGKVLHVVVSVEGGEEAALSARYRSRLPWNSSARGSRS